MVAGPFNVLLLFARLSSLGSSVWSPPLVCPSGCSSERSFQDKDRGGGLRHAVRGRSILEHAWGLHGGLAFNSVTGSLRQLHTSVLVVLADVICVEEDYLCVQYNKLGEELQTDKSVQRKVLVMNVTRTNEWDSFVRRYTNLVLVQEYEKCITEITDIHGNKILLHKFFCEKAGDYQSPDSTFLLTLLQIILKIFSYLFSEPFS